MEKDHGGGNPDVESSQDGDLGSDWHVAGGGVRNDESTVHGGNSVETEHDLFFLKVVRQL